MQWKNVSLSCPLSVRIYVTFLFWYHKLTHAQDWLPGKWIPYTVVFGRSCVLADGSGSWIGQTHLNASTQTHTYTPAHTHIHIGLHTFSPLTKIILTFPLLHKMKKKEEKLSLSNLFESYFYVKLHDLFADNCIEWTQFVSSLCRHLIGCLCFVLCKTPPPSGLICHLLPVLPHLIINHIHPCVLANLVMLLAAHFFQPCSLQLLLGCTVNVGHWQTALFSSKPIHISFYKHIVCDYLFK